MKWIRVTLVAVLLVQVGCVPCAAQGPVYGTPGTTSVVRLNGKAQAFPGSHMPTATADLLVLQSGKPRPLSIPVSKMVVKYAAIGCLIGVAIGGGVVALTYPEERWWLSKGQIVFMSGFLGALGGATATIFFKHSRDIERRSSGRLTIADYGLSEGKKGMYVTFSQVF